MARLARRRFAAGRVALARLGGTPTGPPSRIVAGLSLMA
jgi:hypothetical protein